MISCTSKQYIWGAPVIIWSSGDHHFEVTPWPLFPPLSKLTNPLTHCRWPTFKVNKDPLLPWPVNFPADYIELNTWMTNGLKVHLATCVWLFGCYILPDSVQKHFLKCKCKKIVLNILVLLWQTFID
jgi:hypothetical protein